MRRYIDMQKYKCVFLLCFDLHLIMNHTIVCEVNNMSLLNFVKYTNKIYFILYSKENRCTFAL